MKYKYRHGMNIGHTANTHEMKGDKFTEAAKSGISNHIHGVKAYRMKKAAEHYSKAAAAAGILALRPFQSFQASRLSTKENHDRAIQLRSLARDRQNGLADTTLDSKSIKDSTKP